jgi:hypothetical protein
MLNSRFFGKISRLPFNSCDGENNFRNNTNGVIYRTPQSARILDFELKTGCDEPLPFQKELLGCRGGMHLHPLKIASGWVSWRC